MHPMDEIPGADPEMGPKSAIWGCLALAALLTSGGLLFAGLWRVVRLLLWHE